MNKARGSANNAKALRLSENGRLGHHWQGPTGKRARAYSYTPRRLLLSRLDSAISAMLPPVLRVSLLSVPSLPTLVLLYCLFSVAVWSGYIFSSFLTRPLATTFASSQEISSLDGLPLAHLMSKVSSLRPMPVSIDANVLSTHIDKSMFSACLWTTDSNLDAVVTWAEKWTGPISLVVVSTAVPSSREHTALLAKLGQLRDQTSLLKQTLFAHVLHLSPTTEPYPNVFLNLARVLAPSSRVVLFPGNLSYAPPKNLYRTLVALQPSASSAMSRPRPARKRRPVVLTLREQTSFPFAPLAPLVIPRDDATWCTERFFAGMSREADWEECLWQIWLASFGDVEIRQTQGWTTAPQADAEVGPGTLENPTAIKLHRRLVSKFRSETCALAVRRFAALRDPSSSSDTKKARWLKRVCRAWSS